MVVRARAERPEKFALACLDAHIVDARLATAHQARLVELPLLIAVGAVPVATVVAPFIGETHGNPIVRECPDLLDQPVVHLALPFASEELGNGGTAGEELRPVSPPAVLGIGERDA